MIVHPMEVRRYNFKSAQYATNEENSHIIESSPKGMASIYTVNKT